MKDMRTDDLGRSLRETGAVVCVHSKIVRHFLGSKLKISCIASTWDNKFKNGEGKLCCVCGTLQRETARSPNF